MTEGSVNLLPPPAEHQQSEVNSPQVWTKKVLRDLQVLGPSEKLGMTTTEYFVPRIFDPLMIKEGGIVDPPAGYRGYGNKRDGMPDPVQYDPELPGPQKVLSSGIQGWLLRAGYEKITSFDMKAL